MNGGYDAGGGSVLEPSPNHRPPVVGAILAARSRSKGAKLHDIHRRSPLRQHPAALGAPQPNAQQVTAAVRDSLRRHGGQHGCLSLCATEYGEHPDTAPARMRWALTLTNHLSPAPAAAA